MILLVDNYDSFSYNLYQLTGSLAADIRVIRNDEMTAAGIMRLKPSHIILSPGPGRPDAAGVCEELVAEAAGRVPLLGVCLGHQAVCEAFGAEITYAKKLMHGKQSVVTLKPEGLFAGLPPRLKVARYHSLAADASSLPASLEITAVADDGEVMAVRHKEYPVFGVQFHPESILTEGGEKMLKNFLSCGSYNGDISL